MTYLIYDGTFDGFLTAVFEAYDLRLKNFQLYSKEDEVPSLFAETIEVAYDEHKTKRVKNRLLKLLGKSGVNDLWKATLFESPDVNNILLGVIKYTLKEQRNILSDFGHIDVLNLRKILRKLSRERHRMNAFIRFELSVDGIFYAVIEPDFNVLPLISNHFESRYADQRWLIFDAKRGYGIYYDLKQVTEVKISHEQSDNLPIHGSTEWHPNEQEFQNLWKDYFKSSNIQSRANRKLHLQHIPKRYWKYLTEKRPTL